MNLPPTRLNPRRPGRLLGCPNNKVTPAGKRKSSWMSAINPILKLYPVLYCIVFAARTELKLYLTNTQKSESGAHVELTKPTSSQVVKSNKEIKT